MQEEVDHQDHQHDRDQEGLKDFLHAFRHGLRLVERYGVVDVFGKALLHLGHELPDTCRRLHRIGAGQLVNRDHGGGLAIQAADQVVILRAQFDPRHVPHSNCAAIRSLAHDDVSKLFRRGQTALSPDGIGELLVPRSGLASDLTRRVHGVLRLDRVRDVGDGDAQLRQLIGLYPEPHGILPGAKDLRLPDPVRARDGVIEVDIGIVGQKLGVAGAVRRV